MEIGLSSISTFKENDFQTEGIPKKVERRHLTVEVIRKLLAANYVKSLLGRAKNMRKFIHNPGNRVVFEDLIENKRGNKQATTKKC